MHRPLFLFLFLFTATISFHPHAVFPQVKKHEEMRVAKLAITIHNLGPNEEADEVGLRRQLKTQIDEPFSQVDFDQDLKFLSHGFNKVEPTVEYSKGEVFITLDLWPKPRIVEILFSGNERINTKKLEKELGVKVGTLLNREGFNEAFQKVKKYYVRKGYFETQLDYQIAIDEETNEARIAIKIEEGRAGRIRRILFSGVTKEEQNRLSEELMTQKYNPWIDWLREEGNLNQEMLEHDLLKLTSSLQDLGYADAKITPRIEELEGKKRINLYLDVEKGPLYTFGEITWKGNTRFTNDQINAILRIRPDAPYSPEDIRDTIKNITTLYGARGFIESFVDYRPKLRSGTHVYDLHMDIVEGERYYVGLVKIYGNTTTQERVILRECLLQPGQLFDSRRIEATEERLKNIGYFSRVNVYAVQSEEGSSLGETYRDLHIEVEETSTAKLTFQVGFSSRESFFGAIGLNESNFNSRGIFQRDQDGRTPIRGGGESFHANVSFGVKQTSFALGWTNPYFRDSKWSIGFDLHRTSNRGISSDADTTSSGASVHAQYPINTYLRFIWHYRLTHSRVKLREKDNASERLKIIKRSEGTVSATGVALNYNSTNSNSLPSRGLRSSLKTEIAGLGGVADFVKFSYLNNYYWRMHSKGIVKYTADFEYILPFGRTNVDTVPYNDRLFMGGQGSLRGFRPYVIGPRDTKADRTPLGGISSTLFSMEYLHELSKPVDLFCFLDAGSLQNRKFRIGKFYYSYGGGIRLKVLGNTPILIGMGFPVNADSKSDEKRLFVSLGARF